jgi:hypothetical protein
MLVAGLLLVGLAAPAAAQDSNPNTGDAHISGALDFSNAYFFRGIRQETEGLIIQPYLDLGLGLYESEGTLKALTLNVGTWNSAHHNSPTGSQNPVNRKAWYESDLYMTLGFGVSGGVNASVTYTAYMSPNSQFATVKEVSFKFTVDDTPWLGDFKQYSAKPYVIIANEFDTGTGTGQADGAFCQGTTQSGCSGQGTYIEIGGAPGYTTPRWGVSVPIKVGIGLIDYYQALYTDVNNEVVSLDSKFGFFSVAGVGSFPFTAGPARLGSWSARIGVEYLRLGDMPAFANRDPVTGESEANQVNVFGGLSFSY